MIFFKLVAILLIFALYAWHTFFTTGQPPAWDPRFIKINLAAAAIAIAAIAFIGFSS